MVFSNPNISMIPLKGLFQPKYFHDPLKRLFQPKHFHDFMEGLLSHNFYERSFIPRIPWFSERSFPPKKRISIILWLQEETGRKIQIYTKLPLTSSQIPLFPPFPRSPFPCSQSQEPHDVRGSFCTPKLRQSPKNWDREWNQRNSPGPGFHGRNVSLINEQTNSSRGSHLHKSALSAREVNNGSGRQILSSFSGNCSLRNWSLDFFPNFPSWPWACLKSAVRPRRKSQHKGGFFPKKRDVGAGNNQNWGF